MNTPAGLDDLYASDGYVAFEQEHRSAGRAPARLIRVRQTAHDFTDPGMPELLVALALQADVPYRRNIGDGWTQGGFRTGELSLSPPQTSSTFDWGGNHELLILGLPADPLGRQLRDDLGLDFDALAPLTRPSAFRDAAIAHAIQEIWAEAIHGDKATSLLIDGLTQVVVARLLRLAAAEARPAPARTLSTRQLRRLEEHVDAHLGDNLPVSDLAEVVGLSPYHFARVFKATTGQTPHAYVMERRIALARQLLMAQTLALAEIAAACGFSSQSHMTDLFRRHTGMTPARYRRDSSG